jgi:hypothetical protein
MAIAASLTGVHMLLNKRIYALKPPLQKAWSRRAGFDRACRGFSRGRALGQVMRQGQGSVAPFLGLPEGTCGATH